MTQWTELPEGRSAGESLRTALGTAKPIVTMSRDGLVLIALAWAVDHSPAYETATAATAKGDLELRELGGGTVPTIEAVTKDTPVVIFAGDTIVGGRQNRIINVSVWLKAASVTPIPVSCLEAGRWDAGSRFDAGRKVDYLLRARVSEQVEERARSEHSASVHERVRATGRRASYAADQGAIWGEIAAKQSRASIHSPTAALHHLYEREATDLASFIQAFPCPAGATGVAVGIDGRLVALELFDSRVDAAGAVVTSRGERRVRVPRPATRGRRRRGAEAGPPLSGRRSAETNARAGAPRARRGCGRSIRRRGRRCASQRREGPRWRPRRGWPAGPRRAVQGGGLT